MSSSSSAGSGSAARLPELRVHRDRGEAGQRVDLVDEDAVRAALEEEVHARHPGDAAEAEDRDRQALRLLRDGRRHGRRDEQLRLVVAVLVVVVVELVAGDDLARDGRARLVVAEHRALDLARVDALLDERALVVPQRDLDRGREVRGPLHLRDARPTSRRWTASRRAAAAARRRRGASSALRTDDRARASGSPRRAGAP